MTSNLLSRSLGAIGSQAFQQAETTRLLYALEAAPGVHFDSSSRGSQVADHYDAKGKDVGDAEPQRAHPAGVNSIVIDRFEGK